MNTTAGLFLNLASRPARNRRLYLWGRTALAALIAGSIGLGGYFTVKYGARERRFRAESETTAGLVREAETEDKRLSSEIEKAEKAGRARVDIVNGIIYQKSFSWTGFLSLLEASLPDASYITALSPNYSGDRTIALKIKVVSRNLDDLLALIDNLTARDFRGIRVENEARDSRGRLVSEISLTYERTI